MGGTEENHRVVGINDLERKLGGAVGHPSSKPVHRSTVERLLLTWVTPLVLKGYRSPLKGADVPQLPENLETSNLAQEAHRLWQIELLSASRKTPSLLRVILQLAKWPIVQSFLLGSAAGLCTTVMRPLLLKYIVESVSEGSGSTNAYKGTLLALLLFSTVAEGIFSAASKHLAGDEAGIRFVGAAAALVHAKSMRVAVGAGDSASAKEASLVGNDVIRTFENAKELAIFPMVAVAFIGGIGVLLVTVGLPGLIGVGLMVMVSFVNAKIAAKCAEAEELSLSAADQRLTIMKQVFNGIQAIKLGAWEEPYFNQLKNARMVETEHIRRYRMYQQVSVQLGRVSVLIS